MSFTSLEFAFFLLIVFLIYWRIRKKHRWIVLLCASYLFYAFAGVEYILLLAYVTIVTFLASRYVADVKYKRRFCFIFSVLLILFPLVYFKYTGFLEENINMILNAMGSASELSKMEIVLPIGISFYTFTALGYFIDVERGKITPFNNIFQFAAGISFFPCLVSGPIERQENLIPQIINGIDFDYHEATYGLKQIAWGIFEKLVIADNLAKYVDTVFDNMSMYGGVSLLAGSLFYTVQIYCDFAGYSDMAIGVARLFGIKLTKNFDSPYLAKSFQEFWKRWHISLSSWFRDYIYIPLGGNRKGKVRKQVNLFITMLVSGIWHGAAWTFIFWGGVHGIAQILENFYGLEKKRNKNRFVNVLRTIFVFAICSFLWIFFRAKTFSEAIYMIRHMFEGITSPIMYIGGLSEIGIGVAEVLMFMFFFLILFIHDYFSLKYDVIEKISDWPIVLRWTIYVSMILIIAQFSFKGEVVRFVYAGF